MKIVHGDCLEELKKLEDNSIDAVVTDPPYGLSNTKPAQVADVLKAWVTGDTVSVPAKRGGFMGKDWDSFVPPPAVWEECMRVLKPGGHMAVFAGARTQDLMGLSIRLAGFEIRDTLGWIYGSGFPKSRNIARQMDKTLGEDVPIGKSFNTAGGGERESEFANNGHSKAHEQWSPMSDEAKQWDGWGTALKPAIEPIILARKPLDGTVANNVLTHGVGGLNIDACRVGSDGGTRKGTFPKGKSEGIYGDGINGACEIQDIGAGRFPANVLLDEHAAAEMDEQSGNSSRFFPVFKYQAKAPKKERPVIVREDGSKIQHPTVKPLELMSWLVTLITPPGGVVLNPFAGSGTTLQAARDKGFDAIGIEQDADYIKLIEKRLAD